MNNWSFQPFNPFLGYCGGYADLNYVHHHPKPYQNHRAKVEVPCVSEYDYNPWYSINSLQHQLKQQQQQNSHLRTFEHSNPVEYNGIPHIWIPFQ